MTGSKENKHQKSPTCLICVYYKSKKKIVKMGNQPFKQKINPLNRLTNLSHKKQNEEKKEKVDVRTLELMRFKARLTTISICVHRGIDYTNKIFGLTLSNTVDSTLSYDDAFQPNVDNDWIAQRYFTNVDFESKSKFKSKSNEKQRSVNDVTQDLFQTVLETDIPNCYKHINNDNCNRKKIIQFAQKIVCFEHFSCCNTHPTYLLFFSCC